MDGFPMARPDMASEIWLASVFSVFKNFLRAGVLKKRCFISTMVPGGAPASDTLDNFPPVISIRVPISLSACLDTKVNLETEAMDGSASPLNPNVEIENKSSFEYIFEVAYRSIASMASSRDRPEPLSLMRIRDLPPFSISTEIRSAPASMLFSTSSLTTETGRWTTSPAAI